MVNRNIHPGSDGALALSTPLHSRELRVRPARRRDLLSHMAGAFDLAERREVGHAAAVAYLAHQIAVALGLGPEGALRSLDAGLLHAAGQTLSTSMAASEGNAWVALRFGLDDPVREIASAVHERWDGSGPLGQAHTEIPAEALCIVAAHWAADFADEIGHPLRARARLAQVSESLLLRAAGPAVADALECVVREDETWLAVFGDDLPGAVARLGAPGPRPSYAQVYGAAHAMGEVIDAAVRESGRSLRVSILASELAAEVGLGDSACDLVGVAGYLLDIGQLGVPRSITVKPSILTVDEMETMRRHPGLGARVLEGISGFDEVRLWVEQHHERPDGRGYPGMLDSTELPLPSLILAVADAYWALRAHRPYRAGYSAAEAFSVLRDAAGPQFDADVVAALEPAVDRTMVALAEIDPSTGSDPRQGRPELLAE